MAGSHRKGSSGRNTYKELRQLRANEPTLPLADEPTGALDSDGTDEVIELLSRLHAGGQTVLLVTHNSQVAAAAGRTVRMLDGRILSSAKGTAGHGAGVTIETR